MSYGNLYKIEYYDFFNVLTEIYIKKLDYAGSSTDINAGDDPLRIILNSEGGEKFQNVRGTSVEIDLLSETDFQFISLHTSDFKQYQIQIDKGGSTYWKGWLLPDYYQEPYEQPPYVVTINAADGLGLLKNYDLVYSNGSHLTGKQTIGDILNQIFLKIGTELNLYENINIYEDNINSTAADSILYQVYIDCSIFYDVEGNPMNCYDALVEILKPFNAYITQSEGAWHIVRVPTNKSSYTRRLFTWNSVVGFTYDSNAAYDPQLSTTANVAIASLVRFVGNTLTVSPPWKEFTIRQDYGTKESLLANSTFNYDTFTWDGSRWWVDNWEDYGAIAAPDYSPIPVDKNYEIYVIGLLFASRPNRSSLFENLTPLNPYPNNEYCIKINSSGALPVVGIYNKENELEVSTDNILFHFEYCTNNSSDNVYAQVLIDGASVYYLNNDGSWGLVTDYLDFGADNAVNQWITKEIYTDDIPISGTLYVVLFYVQGVTSPATTWVKWSNIKVSYLPGGIRPEKELELTTTVNSNNIQIPSEIDLILGDMPDHDNNAILYRGGFFYNSGGTKIPTSIWTDGNSSKNDTLVNCMAESMALELNKPYQIISGTIYSKLVDWTTIIREVNNSNYLYMINGGTFYDKAGAWDLELIQFAETYDLLAEDSSTLVTETSDQMITE